MDELSTLALGGIITELIAEGDFKGKPGKPVCARLGGLIKRVAIVGMGKAADPQTCKTWKALGGAAASLAKAHKAETAAVTVLGSPEMDELSTLAAVEGIAAGAMLGTYDDFRFKSKGKGSTLKGLEVMKLGPMAPAVAKAGAMAQGQVLTKQLVSAPPNTCTP